MDPRRLEHFLAVAEHLNFTRAARALHIAQPSLSQSIKTLERELGAPLFLRLSGGLELTGAGRALLAPASRALRALSDAREAMRGVVQVETGSLDLVAPNALMVHPTSTLLAGLRRAHPGVRMTLSEAADSREAAERVLDGRAEVAVLECRSAAEGLTVVPLDTYSLYAVFPAGLEPDGLADGDELPWSGLAGQELISLAPYTVSRQLIERHGLGDAVAVSVHNIETALELVRLGAGTGVLIEPYAVRARASGAVTARLVPQKPHKVGIAFREDAISPTVLAFARVATATIGV